MLIICENVITIADVQLPESIEYVVLELWYECLQVTDRE